MVKDACCIRENALVLRRVFVKVALGLHDVRCVMQVVHHAGSKDRWVVEAGVGDTGSQIDVLV